MSKIDTSMTEELMQAVQMISDPSMKLTELDQRCELCEDEEATLILETLSKTMYLCSDCHKFSEIVSGITVSSPIQPAIAATLQPK